MTLGGGTATAALFSGAVFGYELLWVAPLAMALGVLMLAAVSHQTLSTGARPFDAMRRFAGAPLAWAWALGALAASIIWHFPQYALASSVLVDISDALGLGQPPRGAMGLLVLLWAVGLSMLYASGRMVRAYEPWPVAWTSVDGKHLRIWSAAALAGPFRGQPGEVLNVAEDGLIIATGEGALRVTELQLEGRARCAAQEFANGYPVLGKRLGA